MRLCAANLNSGRLAQLGERRVRNAEVGSSILPPSTNLRSQFTRRLPAVAAPRRRRALCVPFAKLRFAPPPLSPAQIVIDRPTNGPMSRRRAREFVRLQTLGSIVGSGSPCAGVLAGKTAEHAGNSGKTSSPTAGTKLVMWCAGCSVVRVPAMSAPATDSSHSSISSSGHIDGLGRRSPSFDRETGEMLERLRVQPEVAAFETLIRERVVAALERGGRALRASIARRARLRHR